MNLVYDVCHNIAKFEEHTINGRTKKVWVHRKGATRAFPPNHPEIPPLYRKIGQPVLIPGDMGRASWVLVGAAGSMERGSISPPRVNTVHLMRIKMTSIGLKAGSGGCLGRRSGKLLILRLTPRRFRRWRRAATRS
jgi:RNA-splicing ligase RtcB